MDSSLENARQPDTLIVHPPPFNHDQLLKDLEFKPDDDLARWAPWIKAGILLLLTILLGCFIAWRAIRRKKLVAQRDKSAKPPYVWNIRIPSLAPPDPGENFGRTLQALRRRIGGETRLMDLPATVRATIRKGGMAAFQFRQQTQPPEYLLLVDRQNAQDHRARLYDDLYHLLRQNEVLVERFFFDGDIRLCVNEIYPEGLSPDELLFRFPAHRLLIIGTGRLLFSATTGRLAKWTEQFAKWKDRALLSPLPAEDWGRRERALGDLFRFAPASIPGLHRLTEAFEADEELRAPQFDKLAALAFGAPVLLEDGDLLQTLEKHFPDEQTRTWLAACAIWPELHYDLTLWLGQWLAQESEQPVATMARLGDLLRLPWFASGEMPDPARVVLLDWLRQTKPALEPRLRTVLHSLLEENAPPEDSAAWDDFAMRVAFNEWQFTTDPQRKKELEEKIAEWIERNGDPDFIVIRELQGEPGPLDSLLPDAWKKRLFREKIPNIGLREFWKDVLRLALPVLAVAALGLYAFWRPRISVCAGEQATVTIGQDTLNICAASDADRLLLWEYRMQKAAGQGDSLGFDQQYSQFPPVDAVTQTLAAECRANVANAACNAGIPDYQRADSLRQINPRYRLDTSLWKVRACRWFGRAATVDTSLAWIRLAAGWCAENGAVASPLPERGVCRRVAPATIALAMRNRALSQAEYNEVSRDRNGRLDRITALAPLPVGTTVMLLDSAGISYRIEYEGRVGYVIKLYGGKPSLLPCGKVRVTGSGSTTTPATPLALPTMIRVRGGTFTMGSPESAAGRGDDETQHPVTLSGFEIGQYEVTQKLWRAIMGANPSDFQGDSLPVENVSWDDIKVFLKKLNARAPGKNYRLPTEAEWEFAARGGTLSKGFLYAGSADLNKVAWFSENSGSKTHFVGQKEANELGLYDLSGNVYEWCSDWYGDYPAGGKPEKDPVGPVSGSYRVIRGGSWYLSAGYCRVSYRGYATPEYRDNYVGFRLASSPQ